MTRRALAALLLSLSLAAGASAGSRAGGATATSATVSSVTFVFSGRGYGHGVGMSQYGALGYARAGVGYREILAHFYPGTTLGRTPTRRLRVLVAGQASALRIGSASAFVVRDGSGASHPLAAGTYAVDPSFALTGPDGRSQQLPPPLSFRPGAGPLELGGLAYRGSIRVVLDGKALDAVDLVGLEQYLDGVVSAEMPPAWPAEALKAQAVAARSYALAHLHADGAFDLYGDSRDQIYGGVAAETPAGVAAVAATRGQVLLYGGKVADTLFFSTSGGRTASARDVFPGLVPPPPYLVSVPDPYDSISPWHTWGPVAVPAARAARVLDVPGLDALVPEPRAGRAVSVLASGRSGQVTLPAPLVRMALGLRSTWFTVAALSLSRPVGPVPYGSTVVLTGSARGLAQPLLEQRAAGSSWQPGPAVSADASGGFSVPVAPQRTTSYRISDGAVHGSPLVVPVSPRVTLTRAPAGGGLAGSVAPAAPGTVVEIQMLDPAGAAWQDVAAVSADASGSFAAALPSRPGTYRARVASAGGLAAGTSTELTIAR